MSAKGVVLAVAVAALAVWAAVVTVGAPVNGCDNMAGTCLRLRQRLAIGVVEIGCVVAALLAAAAIVRATRRRLSRAWIVGLVLTAAYAGAVLVARPADRLDNRWDGWLAAARTEALR